jgi:hypothetical protein
LVQKDYSRPVSTKRRSKYIELVLRTKLNRNFILISKSFLFFQQEKFVSLKTFGSASPNIFVNIFFSFLSSFPSSQERSEKFERRICGDGGHRQKKVGNIGRKEEKRNKTELSKALTEF